MKVLNLLKTGMMQWLGLPTCEEIESFAYAYLEEDLEIKLARKFEQHLRGCSNCERFIETYRQVARPDRMLQKVSLPPDFERRIVQFLKENR